MESLTQHRTQIYLPSGLYQKAKKLAEKSETTLAEVIRMALRDLKEVKQLSQKDNKSEGWDTFLRNAQKTNLPAGMVASHDDDWGLVD